MPSGSSVGLPDGGGPGESESCRGNEVLVGPGQAAVLRRGGHVGLICDNRSKRD